MDLGASIDLISELVVNKLKGIRVYKDEGVRISLADKGSVTLRLYVVIPVNVNGILSIYKARIIPILELYSLLLKVRWLR